VLDNVTPGADLFQALDEGNLLWHIDKLPIRGIRQDGGDPFDIPGKRVTARMSLFGESPIPLGIVSDGYQVIQNLDCFSPLEELRLDGLLSYSQSGFTRQGARVYVVCELAEQSSLMDIDPHARFIIATSAHDGTGGLRLIPMQRRLHCTNQIPALSRFGAGIISIAHDRNAEGKVAGMAENPRTSIGSMHDWEHEYRRLVETTVTETQVDEFLAKLFPHRRGEATDRMVNNVNRNRAYVRNIYMGSTGTQTDLYGTAAGLFAAATEARQWFMSSSGVRRGTRLLEGRDQNYNDRPWELVSA